MYSLDDQIGSLLIASWFDMMQLMLEISQVIRYFNMYPKDRLSMKLFVLSLLLLDLLSEAGHNMLIYLSTITNWGNGAFLLNQHWSMGMFLPTNGLTSLAVQLFLLHRLFTLQRNWFVVLLLGAFSLASFGGVMGTAIVTLLHPSLSERTREALPSIIWLGCGAIADCGIAGTLVWQLSRIASPFGRTKSIVHRLMVYAVSTGAAPAMLGLASLFSACVNHQSNICVALAFCLGRTYTLTLLWNLNSRQHTHEDGSSASAVSFHRGPSSARGEAGDTKAAVSIVRTVHVDRDGEDGAVLHHDSYGYSTTSESKASYQAFSGV